MTIRLFLTKNQSNTNKQTGLVKLVGQEINVISDLQFRNWWLDPMSKIILVKLL